ncbi:MAG: M20/M25/M40 family metallo-hydrolase [Pyrinomonadaceae bacterium]
MRKLNQVFIVVFAFAISFSAANEAFSQKRKSVSAPKLPKIERRNVESTMEFLAGDAMQGRGSGTQFEWIAGEYFASLMKQFGVEPGAVGIDGKPSYIQTVEIVNQTFDTPQLTFVDSLGTHTLEHGKDMIVSILRSSKVSGKLRAIAPDEVPNEGEVVLIKPDDDPDGSKARSNFGKLLSSKAAAILIGATPNTTQLWSRLARRPVSYSVINGKEESSPALVILNADSMKQISALEQGSEISISAKAQDPQSRRTWNAVGKIEGADPKLKSQVILLSAHMDHLGVDENAKKGEDRIFNGADDDASGSTAVIELARAISSMKKPKRTVYFTFFGSEERGGYGAGYFVDNLPFPKKDLVANLEFEMIGRPDAKVKPDELWLTGYERSNLGPELAKLGAKIVQDPHPEQNFFQRSDNYTLARQGIIAHTVSSFGLHTDYHHKSDEVSTIDFSHMTNAINSMVSPIHWLINSSFVPEWNPGMKP